jgi:hypothetical protein
MPRYNENLAPKLEVIPNDISLFIKRNIPKLGVKAQEVREIGYGSNHVIDNLNKIPEVEILAEEVSDFSNYDINETKSYIDLMKEAKTDFGYDFTVLIDSLQKTVNTFALTAIYGGHQAKEIHTQSLETSEANYDQLEYELRLIDQNLEKLKRSLQEDNTEFRRISTREHKYDELQSAISFKQSQIKEIEKEIASSRSSMREEMARKANAPKVRNEAVNESNAELDKLITELKAFLALLQPQTNQQNIAIGSFNSNPAALDIKLSDLLDIRDRRDYIKPVNIQFLINNLTSMIESLKQTKKIVMVAAGIDIKKENDIANRRRESAPTRLIGSGEAAFEERFGNVQVDEPLDDLEQLLNERGFGVNNPIQNHRAETPRQNNNPNREYRLG